MEVQVLSHAPIKGTEISRSFLLFAGSYILSLSMKAKHVHFVCRGNRYRSRVAEAIFKSYKLTGYKVTSSGIEAGRMKTQIEPYTKALATEHSLAGELSPTKTQTTDKILKDADVIVFLSKDVYDDACKEFDVDPRKSLVWHIADVDGQLKRRSTTKKDKVVVRLLTERTFLQIQAECKRLKTYLTTGGWVDVVDAKNKLTGLRLPIAWVTDRGFWHRGCHAIITTPDKKYLVEKRSSRIIFAPGHLEISMGGAVDSGETSRNAVIREIKEELGLEVQSNQLTLIDVHKWSSYHPHYRKYTKTFLYTYHVALTQNDPMLRAQPSEVALVKLLSRRRVNRLIRTRRLRHLGPLNYGYQYYRRVVKLSRPYLASKPAPR